MTTVGTFKPPEVPPSPLWEVSAVPLRLPADSGFEDERSGTGFSSVVFESEALRNFDSSTLLFWRCTHGETKTG